MILIEVTSIFESRINRTKRKKAFSNMIVGWEFISNGDALMGYRHDSIWLG